MSTLTVADTGVDAIDVLVFRRLEAERWAHLGGRGRGEGWAGIVELHPRQEPLLAAALDTNRVQRIAGATPAHVVGPYYARSAALVPVGHDHFVIFGWPEEHGAPPDDQELAAAGQAALDEVGEISPAKRLADELELLHALRALLDGHPEGLGEALQHVAEVTATSLSCELAVVHDRQHGRIVVHGSLGRALDPEGARRLLCSLEQSSEPTYEQDAEARPLPDPLGADAGISSWCHMPLGQPAEGSILVAHAATSPRGFTSLCQELSRRLAESAGGVIAAAALRDDLRGQISRFALDARRDALTGLGNRLAWDEAVQDAQRAVDAGGPASVLVLDVDHLKAVNDTAGHERGDELLVLVADLLRGVVREGDVVARIGGDEFAVLLPDAGANARDQVAGRLRDAVADSPGVADVPVSVSIGCGTCLAGEQLSGVLCAADARMYAEKGHR